MQGAVKEYAAEVQHTRGVPIHIRVGLNAGAVVVRSIGSDLHMDYTAVGQTTHLAARMEQMAMPGSILITADVLRLAEGYVQVAAVRGFTRFVGRDAELQTLNRALERAGAGQGQVMAVIGEPGVGKSRLFWEFIQSHRTYSWRILECRSVSYGKATAYLPVIDLLKAYCGVDTHDDTRGVREKVTGKLLTLERALERTLPAILTLLEVPVAEQAWQALAELPEERLHRSIAHLHAAEFLYETHLFPEHEYTFKHALTHEVAYGSLLQERRRALHARIVEALEALAGERVTEPVDRLAHHTLRGEVWDKALRYSRNAGDKAAARSGNRDAVAHFDQALVALHRLPEGHDRHTQALALHLSLRQVLFPLGEFDRVLDCFNQAEALAASLGDHQGLGRILSYRGLQCWIMGEHQQAIALSQRALGQASGHHDVALQVLARDIIGRASYTLGDYPRAIEVLTENITALGHVLERERFGRAGLMSVTSRHFLGVCHAEMGTFAEDQTYVEEAVRIAEAANQLATEHRGVIGADASE